MPNREEKRFDELISPTSPKRLSLSTIRYKGIVVYLIYFIKRLNDDELIIIVKIILLLLLHYCLHEARSSLCPTLRNFLRNRRVLVPYFLRTALI